MIGNPKDCCRFFTTPRHGAPSCRHEEISPGVSYYDPVYCRCRFDDARNCKLFEPTEFSAVKPLRKIKEPGAFKKTG